MNVRKEGLVTCANSPHQPPVTSVDGSSLENVRHTMSVRVVLPVANNLLDILRTERISIEWGDNDHSRRARRHRIGGGEEPTDQ